MAEWPRSSGPRLLDSIIINRMRLSFERTEFEIITLPFQRANITYTSSSNFSLSFHLCLRLQHRASRKRDHTFPVTRDWSLIAKTSRIVLVSRRIYKLDKKERRQTFRPGFMIVQLTKVHTILYNNIIM